MTLTELKYIVAVAREKHFGKAAEACFVSQPTLSVAVKKLEDELELKLFERASGEVTVTPLGEEIVRQAQAVLEQAAEIKEIARRGKDPLGGPLKLGVIYTIGPYLLPDLVRQNIARTPQMPLMLQENFTVRLLEMLRTGEIDCAILAEPFPDTGLAIAPLYDEPFMAALPAGHACSPFIKVAVARHARQAIGQRPGRQLGQTHVDARCHPVVQQPAHELADGFVVGLKPFRAVEIDQATVADHAELGRMLAGPAQIGLPQAGEACQRCGVCRVLHRRFDALAQLRGRLFGQRCEQGGARGEVPKRRAGRYPGALGSGAHAQGLNAAFFEQRQRSVDQRLAQIAVVVALPGLGGNG